MRLVEQNKSNNFPLFSQKKEKEKKKQDFFFQKFDAPQRAPLHSAEIESKSKDSVVR